MPRSGDTVTIEAPSGQPLRLRVASTVYDPSLAPSLQEITAYGYLSATPLACWPPRASRPGWTS